MSLFIYQKISSPFSQEIFIVLGLISFAICSELAFNKIFKKDKGYLSAIITGLGLSLLLRSGEPALLFLAVFIALISKRLLIYKGQHIFNPANIALIVMLFFASKYCWIAVGVWDKNIATVILFFLMGIIVTMKVQRVDTSLIFLSSYIGLHALRLFWLGDPMELLLFRFNSLSLIVFTFFMISDPKTTPRSQSARALFSILVGCIAFVFDAVLFERNGLFWGLVIASPIVILLNATFKGEKYLWPKEL